MQHQDLTGSLGPESGSWTSSVIWGTRQPLLTKPQLCCAVSCTGRNIPPQQEGVGWGEEPGGVADVGQEHHPPPASPRRDRLCSLFKAHPRRSVASEFLLPASLARSSPFS